MTRLEMVEKIREKTGVTYEQARETLEKCNWDMLDAIVQIEHANQKAEAEETFEAEPAASGAYQAENVPAPKKRVIRLSSASDLGDKIAAAFKWLGNLIKKGEENRLEVSRKNELILSISLTSLILVFLISWWVPTLLIVAGLFTGYKFRFTGSSITGKIVNSASEKASAKADEIKSKMNEEGVQE